MTGIYDDRGKSTLFHVPQSRGRIILETGMVFPMLKKSPVSFNKNREFRTVLHDCKIASGWLGSVSDPGAMASEPGSETDPSLPSPSSREPLMPGIRIAGNTYVPSLLALREKGYRLVLEYTKIDDERHPFHPYKADWQAEKDGWTFSATTPVELLGLVAIWETRGDSWQTRSEEPDIWGELSATAKVFDLDGNEIEEADE